MGPWGRLTVPATVFNARTYARPLAIWIRAHTERDVCGFVPARRHGDRKPTLRIILECVAMCVCVRQTLHPGE